MNIIVVGGGAGGFFSALAAKEKQPNASVMLLERSNQLLTKVRISGGGRCNVTHACFDPKQLVDHYPRGRRELLGPFHSFQARDTVAWFADRGVRLHAEEDGRMFPSTNSSSTIIDCFLREASRLGVDLQLRTKPQKIEAKENEFILHLSKKPALAADRLILATGSSPSGWALATALGHSVQPPVPSLFTFNIPDFPLDRLAGVSVDEVELHLEEKRMKQRGPLLITHWGFSGPATLKLSALAARFLAARDYSTSLFVDWLPTFSSTNIQAAISEEKSLHPTRQLANLRLFPLANRLWKELCIRAGLQPIHPLKQVTPPLERKLCQLLKKDRYDIRGKTTNKEEFVTCGGITLSEINFKTMESKTCPNLFLCGEMLDIDGVTGGFNFQNAWTTGWIAGRSAAE